MAIFLLVLKIIGIILLSVIGLVLFLLLLILFVPVRYKIQVKKEAEGEFNGKIYVTWLLHLLNVLVLYTDDLYYKVRVGIIPIKKSDNYKKKKDKELSADENIENETGTDNSLDENIDQNDSDFVEEDISTYKVYRANDVYTSSLSGADDIDESELDDKQLLDRVFFEGDELAESELNQKDVKEKNENDIDDEEKKSFWDKIKEVIDNIVLLIKLIIKFVIESIDFIIFENDKPCFLKEKADLIKEKYFNVKKKTRRYIRIVTDDRNKKAVKNCLIHIGKILKHIKPRMLKGNWKIGLSDSYSMGKMLSIYGILFPIIHDKIQLVPDYEKEVIEGKLVIKGKIVIVVLLYSFIKVYYSKDFRRLKRMLDNV